MENKELKRVVSLGYQPLANNLLNKKNEKWTISLEVNYCEKCHNCQLSVTLTRKMFSNYLYTHSSKVFEIIL